MYFNKKCWNKEAKKGSSFTQEKVFTERKTFRLVKYNVNQREKLKLKIELKRFLPKNLTLIRTFSKVKDVGAAKWH